jgi:hypothetical protein
MSEQRERVEVIIRCDLCHRRYGDGGAPILALADRMPGADWTVAAIARRGRRADLPVAVRKGGGPHDPLQVAAQAPPAISGPQTTRLGMNLITSAAAQLACRRRTCTARPRVARAALIELAERTAAAGQRVAYV